MGCFRFACLHSEVGFFQLQMQESEATGAITVWYSSKFPLLYSLYVRSYTGTALGPQSGVLVAPDDISGSKRIISRRMQVFKRHMFWDVWDAKV